MNNDISLNDKPVAPACAKSGLDEMMDCELYSISIQLKDRIRYLKGEISPLFIDGERTRDIWCYHFEQEQIGRIKKKGYEQISLFEE